MKNVFKNIKKGTLMLIMLVSVLSFANEVEFEVVKEEAKKTSITLTDVKAGNLLSIKDNNGIVVYKELIIKSGTYRKGFDLTSLPDGDYFFELHKDVEVEVIPFNVALNTVVYKKELRKTIFKPYTRVKGNVAYVSQLSLDKLPLLIEIYFIPDLVNTPELVYSEKIENTEKINRIYKLSDLGRGTYKINYYSEGMLFTKEIK